MVFQAAGGQIALTERQMKIIGFIHARGSVKSSDLVSMFNVSRQAALKELNSMVEKNLILREGDRRGARYVLR